MNPDRALFGLIVAVVPTAAIVFGLVSFGIIGLRKQPPAPQDEPKAKRPAARKRRPGSSGRPST
jgi:hypothetical protein